MKYSELERCLKKAGCYSVGEMSGHPLWYSPITGQMFRLGHHKSQEVARGTLKDIVKRSGVKF